MTRFVTRRHALRLAAAGLAGAALLVTGCGKEESKPFKNFSVTLPANAGTGYEWTCEIDDTKIAELVNSEVVEETSEEPTAGGPVEYKFTFLAKSQGTVSIAFKLVRPWEEDAEPAEWITHRFKVDGNLNVIEEGREGSGVKPSISYWG